MSKYPAPNEANWPEKAKLSEGVFVIADGELGDITSDGLRGYICTVCGNILTVQSPHGFSEAHHIKPSTYKIKYKGEIFYLERHVCDPCMKREASG